MQVKIFRFPAANEQNCLISEVGPLPRGMRIILSLTSSRARSVPVELQSLRGLLNTLQARGWTIRGAYKRNYLLWKNGRVMCSSRLPVLVLPVERARLSHRHFDCFILGEVLRAVTRVGGIDGIDAQLRASIVAIMNELTNGSDVAPHELFEALYDAALKKVTLTPW